MPIYKPEEYDAVLARIKAAIKEQDIQMEPVLSDGDDVDYFAEFSCSGKLQTLQHL